MLVSAEGSETLVDRAYRLLRVDIIRGARAPGERLRIEKLKSIYSIGPTPLREALQKLSVDGLVLTEGNRGFTVSPLRVEEFEDLNVARTAIEKEAIRLSIARGDAHWEARVVAAHYLLSREDEALSAARDRVPDSWERANTDFHTAIVSACGSAWLLRVRSSLVDLVERYRRASIYQRRGERQLDAEHSDILQAVLARDAERACALTEQHFSLTAQTLVELANQKSAGNSGADEYGSEAHGTNETCAAKPGSNGPGNDESATIESAISESGTGGRSATSRAAGKQ